jgi:hypothetical protein
MSKQREIKPLPPMEPKPKKPTDVELKYQQKLADFGDLNRVMSALYRVNKHNNSPAVFFNPQELEAETGKLEGVDFSLVCKQISLYKLTSCGQGGSYYIYWDTIKGIATGGGFRK